MYIARAEQKETIQNIKLNKNNLILYFELFFFCCFVMKQYIKFRFIKSLNLSTSTINEFLHSGYHVKMFF